MEQSQIKTIAENIHAYFMKETENEPLDGDETADFCESLNFELDLLNGNETETKNNWPRYTVCCDSRISKYSHGSEDAEKTCCGKKINNKWVIMYNQFDGHIDCPKCLKKLMLDK